MLGATAPRTSMLFETRAADTVPTEAAVFYCAVVAAVGTLAEVITSHTAIVKMETRRTSLVVGDTRVTQMRLLTVAVAAVFTAAALGMNAYAILACERLRSQTAVPRAQFTQQAADAIVAASTLRNFLIVAISFNSFAAVTGLLRACSASVDGKAPRSTLCSPRTALTLGCVGVRAPQATTRRA